MMIHARLQNYLFPSQDQQASAPVGVIILSNAVGFRHLCQSGSPAMGVYVLTSGAFIVVVDSVSLPTRLDPILYPLDPHPPYPPNPFLCPPEVGSHLQLKGATPYHLYCQVDKTQLMDVLKEEPLFSHDHFSEVKAASTGQTEPSTAQDSFGGFNCDQPHIQGAALTLLPTPNTLERIDTTCVCHSSCHCVSFALRTHRNGWQIMVSPFSVTAGKEMILKFDLRKVPLHFFLCGAASGITGSLSGYQTTGVADFSRTFNLLW